jgi:hypothetical protein
MGDSFVNEYSVFGINHSQLTVKNLF